MSAAQLVLKRDQMTPLLNELALVACQTLLWVQGSNVCSVIWAVTSHLNFQPCLHISNFTHPSILKQEAFENFKT